MSALPARGVHAVGARYRHRRRALSAEVRALRRARSSDPTALRAAKRPPSPWSRSPRLPTRSRVVAAVRAAAIIAAPAPRRRISSASMRRMIRPWAFQGGNTFAVLVRDRSDVIFNTYRPQGAFRRPPELFNGIAAKINTVHNGRHRLRRRGRHPCDDAHAVPGELACSFIQGWTCRRCRSERACQMRADIRQPRSTGCPWGTSSSARRLATRFRASPTTSTSPGQSFNQASRS